MADLDDTQRFCRSSFGESDDGTFLCHCPQLREVHTITQRLKNVLSLAFSEL